ncbi:hypothetical protein AGMMS49991_10070 [Spirochaetia bacterium]|nr:hypothetical protein AGMMS49991_10070 [Spirochaetia bacterium]
MAYTGGVTRRSICALTGEFNGKRETLVGDTLRVPLLGGPPFNLKVERPLLGAVVAAGVHACADIARRHAARASAGRQTQISKKSCKNLHFSLDKI